MACFSFQIKLSSASKRRRMPGMKSPLFLSLAGIFFCLSASAHDPALNQLPHAMHVEMKDLPHVRVGIKDGDLTGADNRALQAAVDYVANFGGGVVEIGEG